MAVRYVYLIRHGRFHYRSKREHLEGSLDSLGHRQAKRLARALKRVPVTSLTCSTLRRAQQTAAHVHDALGKRLKPRSTHGLRECVAIIPPEHAKALARFDNPDVLRRNRDRLDRFADSAFKKTRGKDKHDVFVAHGDVIRYLVCKALGIDPVSWKKLGLMNHCGISILRIDASGVATLMAYNRVGHLLPSQLTLHASSDQAVSSAGKAP